MKSQLEEVALRLPDRVQIRLGALTNDLTRAADETAKRARDWAEHLGSRFKASSLVTRHAEWVQQPQRERGDDDRWRAESVSRPPHLIQTAAPVDFTAGVMARIAAQQAQAISTPVALTRLTVEPIRVLAGTVCISAMVTLASSCVLAILAPAQALALLGWLLGAAVFILLMLRESLGLVAGLITDSGAILMLGSLGALAIIALLRVTHGGDQIAREV